MFLHKVFKSLPYQMKKLFARQYADSTYEHELMPINKRYAKNYKACKQVKKILHINTFAGKGGASKIAYSGICQTLHNHGIEYSFYTSKSFVKDENVYELIDYSSKERKLLTKEERKRNWTDFFQMETFNILKSKEFHECDIVHLHNIHGNYFNPFILPLLSSKKPTIWTLHDQNAYTASPDGCCPSNFNCNKWVEGCNNCAYNQKHGLKDTSEFIYSTRKELYKNSHLTIVTPSNWLKTQVDKSILGHFDVKVIHNGINEQIFRNYEKQNARRKLNLPLDKKILLYSADFGIDNPNKGGHIIKQVYEHYKNREDIMFLAIGGGDTAESTSNLLVVPYIYDENSMAQYYSAADLFIYPSLADSFGLVVAESIACQTPVVTFQTGGIPEIVEHLNTAYIAKQNDIADFITGIETMLNNPEMLAIAGLEGRKTALEKFTLDRMADNYLKLYNEISDSFYTAK